MLVLSRKTGEQVVLPSCGVTIEVVKIAGNKVRLGVQAPPETGVHRREIWERISNRQGTCMESPPTNAANGSPPADGPTTLAASGEADVCRRLARRINQRTRGCIRSLSVDSVDGRIVVSGRASTYHACQLACAAAMELLGRNLGDDNVHFDIHVVPTAAQHREG